MCLPGRVFQVGLASVAYNQNQSLNLSPRFLMYWCKLNIYLEMVVNGQAEDHGSVVCFRTNSALPEFQTDFMYGSPKGQGK